MRSPTTLWTWAGVACWLLVSTWLCAASTSRTFSFALIGDIPYNPLEEAKFLNLIEHINGTNLAFVVHDGDFKNGLSPCSDELFHQRFTLFQRFAHPFIFMFGDNEWVDCHRVDILADPLERLEKLRAIFTQGEHSLGQRTLPLQRQSAAGGRFGKYREHVRWLYGEVMFMGLNVTGSNNNRGRTPQGDAEYHERNAAVLAWMRDTFALAHARQLRGLMLIIQAAPFTRARSREASSGYTDFLAALENQTLAFGKPVVLVHGDAHEFRLDKPLIAASSRRMVEHFTRVGTFGTPDVHWVRGVVDLDDPEVFSFKPIIVDKNRVKHRP